jgi:hypothetical protein
MKLKRQSWLWDLRGRLVITRNQWARASIYVPLIILFYAQQLNDASKFLLEKAASLGSSVQAEQDFWDEALEMRRKCWLIQPGSAFQSYPGTSMASGERSFYVQYGFGDGKSDVSMI